VSANVHQQIESQLVQDTTAVHQLRSLLYSTERQLPMLKLSADTAVASSHVRLLGMDISLDLSFDRHISRVCAMFAVPRHHVASRNFTTRCMTAWRRAAYQHDDVATRGPSPRRSEARSISKTWCRVVSRDGVARSLCSTWCRAVYQHDKTTWCSPFDLRSIGRQRGRYMTLIGINFYNATHSRTFSTS